MRVGMGRDFCLSSASPPNDDGGGGGDDGGGLSFTDLLFLNKVSSSNQLIGYGALPSLLHMQVESLAKQGGKIYASEVPMNMESCMSTEMEEQSKVAQTHHFPQKEICRSCETPTENSTHLHQFSGEDQTDVFPRISIGNPLDDGYNWRKYGQKQVRGCNCPRSYYRCSHPSCQAKRKVEHALDGQITEIVYKGNHNHPKPLHTKRPALVSSYKLKEKTSDLVVDHIEDLKPYFQDMGSSASDVNKSSHIHANFSALLAGDSCLSTLPSKNDEVVATGKTIYFGNVDESHSKERMKDGSPENVQGSRHLCPPKVVVQTFSTVDVLEDGYRWRKYGQKVVKGNPNPRSYYKCTTPGCQVRKHIERAPDDVRSVITSYEGKHNHEVPQAKNSNNICPSGSAHFSELNPQSQNASCGSTSSKPEPQYFVHGLCNNFETCCEYPKASSFGMVTDSEVSPFSIYQTILQPPSRMPLDAFGMPYGINMGVPPVFHVQDFDIEMPNPYSMESDHSEYASASCDLYRSGCCVSEFRASHSHGPKMDTRQTLTNPEKDDPKYDSPQSTLCYGSRSPPENWLL